MFEKWWKELQSALVPQEVPVTKYDANPFSTDNTSKLRAAMNARIAVLKKLIGVEYSEKVARSWFICREIDTSCSEVSVGVDARNGDVI